VSGKGLPASLFMAATKALYRSISSRDPADLARIMREANAEIGRDNPEAFFVTLVAAVLDVATGQLWYVSAGHEAPWIVHVHNRTVGRLEGGGGPPLCVLDDFAYETSTAQLRSGDTVLMVTDGVTEALDPGGELFGTPRVTGLVVAAAREPARSEPARLVADLVAAVRTFREPFEPADDLTLLGVQWLGPPDAADPGDTGISAR
jgi:serine phosphatase RsbU (regulator of sigma subunit)